jgi:hypothetical protein
LGWGKGTLSKILSWVWGEEKFLVFGEINNKFGIRKFEIWGKEMIGQIGKGGGSNFCPWALVFGRKFLILS